jgi:MFS family permease
MAALAMTATLPGRTHGLGLITAPLLDDLSIPERLFSRLNFLAVLLGALLAWPTGWLLDRIGSRIVGGLVSLALGTTVVLMSTVRDVLPLFLYLLLLRGFGQGALSTVSMAMVGKWFSRRLGLAMGVFSMLLGIGFIASTPTLEYAVQQVGWRPAWFWVGVLLLGLGPLTLLLVRSVPTPREFESEASVSDPIEHSSDATLPEALASPCFWVYTLAASLFGLTWSAIALFNELILAEHGFGKQAYLLAMTTFAGVGLLSSLLGGWACKHWPLGRLLAIGLLFLAAALGIFPWIRRESEMLAYTCVFGCSGGLITVVYFSFYGKAFGRSSLGRIQAAAHICSVFASAIGPECLAWSKQTYGSYDPFFLASVPLLLLLAFAAWWVPLPARASVIARA